MASATSGKTRSSQQYVLTSTFTDGREPTGHPCSVSEVVDGGRRSLCTGPSLVNGPTEPLKFFEFLKRWGGTWMWEDITNEGDGFQLILYAITGGTALWVTDGSYNKDVAPTVSGARWML